MPSLIPCIPSASRWRITCSILAFVFSSGFAWGNPIFVRIHAESQIYGAEIRVGEIAEIIGDDEQIHKRIADLSLGRAPAPGKSLQLTRSALQHQIDQAFKPISTPYQLDIPQTVQVKRLAMLIDADYIEQLITTSLQQTDGGMSGRGRIRLLTKIQPLALPHGATGKVEQLQTLGKSGVTTWKITLYDQGKVARRMYVRTNRVQGNGQKLSAGERGSPQEQGSAAVRTRQRVILHYRSKSLHLSTMVIALQGGYVGDLIQVRNEKSKKILYARIVGDREVEIAL